MKILIDLTSLADNFSGIERYAACLALGLTQNKTHNYILIFKESVHEMFKEISKESNVESIILQRCNKLMFNQIKLPFEIYKHKADCYLFLAFPVPIFLFKKNMVSTIHDICCWDCPETMNGMSKWYFRISHRIALKKCKAIITISEFSKHRIMDKLKFDEKKIWLIYCGVDEKFLNYKGSNDENKRIKEKYKLPDKYLLSLSTLEPRKNLGILIEAYTHLVLNDNFDIPLVLAGRKGWKMDEVLSSIDSKARETILFTGFIDDEDLPAVYANAYLFIFPSLYEGFGMPPLEALACGTKILSSDSSSLPEVLGNDVTYFKNNNIEDLYKAMKNIYQYNVEISSNKQVAKYSWDMEVKKLINYLGGLYENCDITFR